MFKTFFIILVMVVSSFISTAQPQESTNIQERISLYVPILQPPQCITYLTEFGVGKNIVDAYAKTIGMQYFGTMELPNLDGIYSSVYLDPENLVGVNGRQTTEHVVYGFVFTPDGEYFSFSTNIKFKTPKLAKEFQSKLLKNIGVKSNIGKDVTETVICGKTGEKRVIVVKLDGNSLTYVIMDLDTILRLSIDTSKI